MTHTLPGIIRNRLMFKYYLLPVVLLAFNIAYSQNNIQISVTNSSLAATDSVLPFWFVANRHGKIQSSGQFLNVSEITLSRGYLKSSKLSYSWGANLVTGLGKSNYYQLNQAYAGLTYRGWEFIGGTFYDEVRYSGLSTTNGNIARSLNARPVPMVRFSTQGYKPVPFLQNRLNFKAEYDEGLLNDNRYVKGAHLHHKSLYFSTQPKNSWTVEFGLEHYAMWGGTSRSESIGKMPDGWKDYWRYVFALPGGKDFPTIDRNNSSGNQLGTYQLSVVRDFSELKIVFYISHPWEDNSGLNLHNRRDNLLGLHIDFNDKNNFITDVVYEFTNTRNQSHRDSSQLWNKKTNSWRKLEIDDYFNHTVYRSGFTYHQMVMSSPLFIPADTENGILAGIKSNRFFSHHLGAKGNINQNIIWKGLLTYTQHLGTYVKPFTTAQKQVSGLFEISYNNSGFPLELTLAVSADSNTVLGNNIGFQFSLTKKW